MKYINDNQENQPESKTGLIIQALDRFFADIYLKIIDDVFLYDKRLLYNRKVDDIVILFNNYSIYNETLELIENKLSSIRLKLNTEKTELIDLSNLNNKEEKFIDMVIDSYTDGSYYNVILLNIQTNFKMGKANRIFKWRTDSGSNFNKYLEPNHVHFADWERFIKRDVYGKDTRNIYDDYSIIALQNDLGFVGFMLDSKISVAMKVRIIKENFNVFKRIYPESIFLKNEYYLYVLLNCIIQNFAISDQKDFENSNEDSVLKDFCSDDSIISWRIGRNKIIKEIFDYLQLNKKNWS